MIGKNELEKSVEGTFPDLILDAIEAFSSID
jgi:hypothetical protein